MTIFRLPGCEGHLKKHAASLAPNKALEEPASHAGQFSVFFSESSRGTQSRICNHLIPSNRSNPDGFVSFTDSNTKKLPFFARIMIYQILYSFNSYNNPQDREGNKVESISKSPEK